MHVARSLSAPRARWIAWSGFALVLLLAPRVFPGDLSLAILCQIGIAIVACLSYNILLGQGGMLSFGHAVYTGLGAYAAMHALNAATAGGRPSALLVALIPLAGGLAGLLFALPLGYVSTRKSGTAFAMITLGLGELVFALSLMAPGFFGGEGGLSGNRMARPLWSITFGPQRQVYGLIAGYTFLSVVAMYALTRTPLGRMLNAVRDNPQRVEFIGYDARRIRHLAFIVAGFFAGIAGGLAALNFEIVSAEAVGAARSGSYLLFTFLGGSTVFFGPIIGAVLMVLAFTLFSALTKAWLLYLGLIFMLMVVYAPGGIAGLIVMNLRMAACGRLRPLLPHYLALAATGALALLGLSALIEMVYRHQLEGTEGSALRFLGLTLDERQALYWLLALAVTAVGAGLFAWARRHFQKQWRAAQEAIEQDVKQREAGT